MTSFYSTPHSEHTCMHSCIYTQLGLQQYLFMFVCVCVMGEWRVHMFHTACVWKSEDKLLGVKSLLPLWGLGIKLRTSGLAASLFSNRAISLTLYFFF